MCDLLGLRSSDSRFSFTIVILVDKATTIIATNNISTLTPTTPRRQQTPPFTRRRHLPHQRYNHLHHSPVSEHRAVTIYAGRMEERRGRSNNLPPKRPRKISRPKLPRGPPLIKLIPFKIRSEERRGEGWRVVSRLAGARMRRKKKEFCSWFSSVLVLL